MPLILPKEVEQDWLNPNLNENQINDLMKPLEENQLEANTISKLITNRKDIRDKPEVHELFEYPELTMFD